MYLIYSNYITKSTSSCSPDWLRQTTALENQVNTLLGLGLLAYPRALNKQTLDYSGTKGSGGGAPPSSRLARRRRGLSRSCHVGTGFGPMAFVAYGGLQPPSV